jgi:GNAT superfamily N-acetyltransferase
MNILVPELLEVITAARDGSPVHLRPILPGDKAVLREGMHRLSPQSRYFRFFSPVEELSDEQLRYFTELDFHDHFAFGAFVADPEPLGIGVARYIRLREDPTQAEYAVAVVDEWHGRGIGTLLLGAVLLAAHHNGIETCFGEVLRTNAPMIDMARGFGATHDGSDPGEVRTLIDPAAWAAKATGEPWDEIRRIIAEVSPPLDG